MRAVIQRVSRASVTVAGVEQACIGRGLLALLGIAHADGLAQVEWMAGKLARLRIFADDAGRMNRSVVDISGEVLVVSQFTLLADAESGNRPSFTAAARPEQAEPLYRAVAQRLGELLGRAVPTGVFGADMAVELCNDGPVTILLDSPG